MSKKTTFLLLLISAMALELNAASIFPGFTGKQLIDSVRANYKPASLLGYDNARAKVYGEIDITADSLVCPYSGWTIHSGPTADPVAWATANDINCEHTWPQSLEHPQSPNPDNDMNHLFGTEMQVNNDRGNSPFGEVDDDNPAVYWNRNNVRTQTKPGANIDEWAEAILNTQFEPREIQKGRTARAMYYMLTMYSLADTSADSSWWQGQKDTLYAWHCRHPAAAAESARTYDIASYQNGKINPFILDSTLIRRCYFPSIPTNTQVNFASTAITKNESDGAFNLTVNISSPGGSSATTVDVVLTGGTGDAADVSDYTTQTLTFPAGSSAPQNAVITIYDDALQESNETIIFRLRNVSGGSSAAAGADSVFTLTINDNDTPLATTVGFSPVSTAKTEGDAPFNITVAIANPSGSNATTADVVLASGSGSAADIDNYATQTVTFPAGSFASQNVAITITDDALVEGAETLVFKLRSVSGGTSATAGADSSFTLSLSDNEGGSSFLFEPFDYPAGDSINGIHNWTLHNGTANPIRVVAPGLTYSGYKNKAVTNACSLVTNGEDVNRSFAAQTSGAVYASFIVSVDSAQTTGDYFFHLSTATLSTSYFVGRVYVKRDASGNLAFGLAKASEGATYTGYDYARKTSYLLVLKYTFAAGASDDSVSLFVIDDAIPGSEPGSATLGPLAAPLADPATIGTVALRQGTAGSAAVLKLDDIKIGSSWSNVPLAVTMSSFTCGYQGNAVRLCWRTESEVNSYCWIISRSEMPDGPYAEIARLDAAGASSQPRDYAWTDNNTAAGTTYYYRLAEQSLSGITVYYGPLNITVPRPQARQLPAAAYPNPFRISTTISYQLSAPGQVSLRIYNAAGQLVRTIGNAPANLGVNHAEWDGRSDAGKMLANGVYVCRLKTDGETRQIKLVLMR